MGVLEYSIERQGPMTAWVTYEASSRSLAQVLSIKKGQAGPWVASVIIKARAGQSDITLTWSLKAGARQLEAELATRWMEIGTPSVGVPKLQMKFPLALRQAKATYEIPFGAIERTENAGQEVPALRWADVNGKTLGKPATAGMALLNDSKNGHSLDGSTLRLTLLRSSHDPDPLPEIGDHTMRMAIAPHGAAPDAAELMKLAAAFSQPLQVVGTDRHEGSLPPAAEAVTVDAPGAVVTSIKQTEDGGALIVRLLETRGRTAQVRVNFNTDLLGRLDKPVEVDLLERPLKASSAKATPGGFSVRLRPHAIASVRLSLK